jgi:hypothetical protein
VIYCSLSGSFRRMSDGVRGFRGRKGATVLLTAGITEIDDLLCRNVQTIVAATHNNHSPMRLRD